MLLCVMAINKQVLLCTIYKISCWCDLTTIITYKYAYGTSIAITDMQIQSFSNL